MAYQITPWRIKLTWLHHQLRSLRHPALSRRLRRQRAEELTRSQLLELHLTTAKTTQHRVRALSLMLLLFCVTDDVLGVCSPGCT